MEQLVKTLGGLTIKPPSILEHRWNILQKAQEEKAQLTKHKRICMGSLIMTLIMLPISLLTHPLMFFFFGGFIILAMLSVEDWSIARSAVDEAHSLTCYLTFPLTEPLMKYISQHNDVVRILLQAAQTQLAIGATEENSQFGALARKALGVLEQNKRELETMSEHYDTLREVKVDIFDQLGTVFAEGIVLTGDIKETFQRDLDALTHRLDVEVSLTGLLEGNK